jgi:hypothetical protein
MPGPPWVRVIRLGAQPHDQPLAKQRMIVDDRNARLHVKCIVGTTSRRSTTRCRHIDLSLSLDIFHVWGILTSRVRTSTD